MKNCGGKTAALTVIARQSPSFSTLKRWSNYEQIVNIKKIIKKFLKPIDKKALLWYTIDTVKERGKQKWQQRKHATW
jgi:hypothetical protein